MSHARHQVAREQFTAQRRHGEVRVRQEGGNQVTQALTEMSAEGQEAVAPVDTWQARYSWVMLPARR
jgi:hypothetical protein